MLIDGKKIAETILNTLRAEVTAIKKEKGVTTGPQLAIFCVSPTDSTLSFISKKQEAAEHIGGNIETVLYKNSPRFEDFINRISTYANKKDIHGIIIQEPLPSSLSTSTLHNVVSLDKDIEGLRKKSFYDHPIGLAILTALKNVYIPVNGQDNDNAIFNTRRDVPHLKQILKRKKILLIGRGKTGGTLISETLSRAKIPFININSKTPDPEEFIRQADIVISAVGKDVVHGKDVKPGSILMSIGMRKEEGLWKGDFNQEEIKDRALAYTPTPGGIGPLNVAYLMKNLVDAWRQAITPMNY